MKPQYHAAASVVTGAALYAYTSSAPVAVYAALAGVLLDADHIPDFLMQNDIKGLNLGRLCKKFSGARLPKLYLFLHSYELVILFFLAGHLAGWNEKMLGLCAGAFVHMVMDQFSNNFRYGLKPFFYFLSVRAAKGFRKEALTENGCHEEGISPAPPI